MLFFQKDCVVLGNINWLLKLAEFFGYKNSIEMPLIQRKTFQYA